MHAGTLKGHRRFVDETMTTEFPALSANLNNNLCFSRVFLCHILFDHILQAVTVNQAELERIKFIILLHLLQLILATVGILKQHNCASVKCSWFLIKRL